MNQFKIYSGDISVPTAIATSRTEKRKMRTLNIQNRATQFVLALRWPEFSVEFYPPRKLRVANGAPNSKLVANKFGCKFIGRRMGRRTPGEAPGR